MLLSSGSGGSGSDEEIQTLIAFSKPPRFFKGKILFELINLWYGIAFKRKRALFPPAVV